MRLLAPTLSSEVHEAVWVIYVGGEPRPPSRGNESAYSGDERSAFVIEREFPCSQFIQNDTKTVHIRLLAIKAI